MLKPIKNDADLHRAVERINELFGCPMDTSESDELEVLMVLVEEYENRVYPIEDADPVAVIRQRMLDLNLKQKDLIQALGHSSIVSEVLSGKRSLTVKMIRNLCELLRVEAGALIQSSPKEKTA